MKYKVSVIVPVYNGEKTIASCLNSLLTQTLEAMEIIVVNDASTDATAVILELYEERFADRLAVVNLPENHGAGGARNYGIKKARGAYIGFTDSDDVAAPQMYEKLYAKAQEGAYDVVDCGFYQEEKDSAIIFTTDELTGVLNEKQRAELIVSGGYIWSKLFRRELFEDKNFIFREKAILEDADFLTYVFASVRSIGNVKEILYCYKDTEDSASKVVKPEAYCKNIEEAIQAVYDKVHTLANYEAIREAVEYELLQMYSYGLNLCRYWEQRGRDCSAHQKELVRLRCTLVSGDYTNSYVQQKIAKEDIILMQQADMHRSDADIEIETKHLKKSGKTADNN